MTEQERQRAYIDGMSLLEKSFAVLRTALDIDDKPDPKRNEVKIALFIREAKERLGSLVYERQTSGIKPTPENTVLDGGTF